MNLCVVFLFISNVSGFVPFSPFRIFDIPSEPILSKETFDDLQKPYDRSWYVVAQIDEITEDKPHKVTVWGKDYVIWKTKDNKYNALEDVCSHKGAALSIGTLKDNCIVCPYHGYEFNPKGELVDVPGINFKASSTHKIRNFTVVERYDWLYLNIMETPAFITPEKLDEMSNRIFIEPEATDDTMTKVSLYQSFKTYPRLVSENSLDIMHIAFVHTFGNKVKPAPTYENPPKEISPDHWRTSYIYESGKDSMVSRMFNTHRIDIDNEFSLPHTTIARIKFGGKFVNTVVTAACPINERETKLFVKTYRNFFESKWCNGWFRYMMRETLNQDKVVIESIKTENADGKFNMKFDKLQNVYRTLYKKYIH